MSKLVWAFQPLPDLEGQTGFVSCDDEIADRLIASGQAQDPRIGANTLQRIRDTMVPTPQRQSTIEREREHDSEYDTKVMTPKRKK